MATELRHDTENTRYVFTADGEPAGLIDYTLAGNTIHLVHTEIDPAQRGKGLGGQLVQQTLDLIRDESKLRVAPDCPFVRDFIAERPEYHELTTR